MSMAHDSNHSTRFEVKPFKMNRRESVRHAAGGTAIAVATKAERRVVSTVDLIDASTHGLGFQSPTKLPLGAQVKLHFNGQPTPGRSGTIVRCEIEEDGEPGYRIGIVCDATVAAA